MFKLRVLSLVDLAFRHRFGSDPPVGEQRGVFSGFFFPAEMARSSDEIDLSVGSSLMEELGVARSASGIGGVLTF